jgi:hypothetical protein
MDVSGFDAVLDYINIYTVMVEKIVGLERSLFFGQAA